MTAESICKHKFTWRLPYKQDELLAYLQQQTFFIHEPELNQVKFTKFFFPGFAIGESKHQKRDASISDDVESSDDDVLVPNLIVK